MCPSRGSDLSMPRGICVVLYIWISNVWPAFFLYVFSNFYVVFYVIFHVSFVFYLNCSMTYRWVSFWMCSCRMMMRRPLVLKAVVEGWHHWDFSLFKDMKVWGPWFFPRYLRPWSCLQKFTGFSQVVLILMIAINQSDWTILQIFRRHYSLAQWYTCLEQACSRLILKHHCQGKALEQRWVMENTRNSSK